MRSTTTLLLTLILCASLLPAGAGAQSCTPKGCGPKKKKKGSHAPGSPFETCRHSGPSNVDATKRHIASAKGQRGALKKEAGALARELKHHATAKGWKRLRSLTERLASVLKTIEALEGLLAASKCKSCGKQFVDSCTLKDVAGGGSFGVTNAGGGPVMDIHPVQVVQVGHAMANEPVPMVAGKRTMVRVYVRVPGGTPLRGVTCELKWDDGTRVQTTRIKADLFEEAGRTKVKNQSNGSTQDKTDDANWAFNFIFKNARGQGREMPSKLKLKATLYEWFPNKVLGTLTEKSGVTFTIRQPKRFKVLVMGLSRGKVAFTGNIKKIAEQIRQELLMLFPVTERHLKVSVDRNVKKSDPENGQTESDHITAYAGSRLIRAKLPHYDAIVVLTNPFTQKVELDDGSMAVPAGLNAGYSKVSFVGSSYRWVTPHEIAHDRRFIGPHTAIASVTDAWDAGGRDDAATGRRVGGSRYGQKNLMGIRGGYDWISAGEYKLLMGKLCR